jgi:UDP-2,3-diacylglucosamine pyrophosphatase LpxH
MFGRDYWSLAKFLKHKVKNAVSYISSFEKAVATEARHQKVDGLICGHIHHPEISEIREVMYLNCGDWVESCTALVEHHDGSFELLRWTGRGEVLKTLAPNARRPATPATTDVDEALGDLAA